MITNYPLCWPQNQRRTPRQQVTGSQFKMSGDKAQKAMLREIDLMNGRNVIISSNVPVRKDGGVYADAARRRMDDCGVAVYFDYKGKQQCIACDRWESVAENIRAIGMTIEALRGIARWGTEQMMEAAFVGYAALPPPMVTEPPRKPWREVFHFGEGNAGINAQVVRDVYLEMAKRYHPDSGTMPNADRMAMYNAAYEEAKKELGAP